MLDSLACILLSCLILNIVFVCYFFFAPYYISFFFSSISSSRLCNSKYSPFFFIKVFLKCTSSRWLVCFSTRKASMLCFSLLYFCSVSSMTLLMKSMLPFSSWIWGLCIGVNIPFFYSFRDALINFFIFLMFFSDGLIFSQKILIFSLDCGHLSILNFLF